MTTIHVTYRKPKHVSSGKKKAAHSIPVLPEHRLKFNRNLGIQICILCSDSKVLPTYAQSDAENEGEVGGDGHDVPRAERELLSLGGDRHICRSSGRSVTRSTDE